MVFPIAAALGASGSIFVALLAFLGIIFGGPIIKMLVGLLVAFWLVSSGILPPYMAIIIVIAMVLFFMGKGK